jgi:hypothetical protein
VRFVISDIIATSCRTEQAYSDDGGKTWEVQLDRDRASDPRSRGSSAGKVMNGAPAMKNSSTMDSSRPTALRQPHPRATVFRDADRVSSASAPTLGRCARRAARIAARDRTRFAEPLNPRAGIQPRRNFPVRPVGSPAVVHALSKQWRTTCP